MGALIGLILFVVLSLWILGDMWLMRRSKLYAPLPMDPNKVDTKQLKQGRLFLIGFGITLYIQAYNEWISPSQPPFDSGRFYFGRFLQALYENFGPQSIMVFWIAGGTAFILLGLMMRPKKLSPN